MHFIFNINICIALWRYVSLVLEHFEVLEIVIQTLALFMSLEIGLIAFLRAFKEKSMQPPPAPAANHGANCAPVYTPGLRPDALHDSILIGAVTSPRQHVAAWRPWELPDWQLFRLRFRPQRPVMRPAQHLRR